MKSLGLLFGASLLVWVVLAYPSWRWWGETALIHSAVAWALCVLPALATTAWVLRREQSPEMRVLGVLAGSTIRLAASLGGGLLLTRLFPDSFTKIFWVWVGVFYAILLTLEVWLLVRHHQNSPSVS